MSERIGSSAGKIGGVVLIQVIRGIRSGIRGQCDVRAVADGIVNSGGFIAYRKAAGIDPEEYSGFT